MAWYVSCTVWTSFSILDCLCCSVGDFSCPPRSSSPSLPIPYDFFPIYWQFHVFTYSVELHKGIDAGFQTSWHWCVYFVIRHVHVLADWLRLWNYNVELAFNCERSLSRLTINRSWTTCHETTENAESSLWIVYIPFPRMSWLQHCNAHLTLPGISVTAPIRRSTPWAFIRNFFHLFPL